MSGKISDLSMSELGHYVGVSLLVVGTLILVYMISYTFELYPSEPMSEGVLWLVGALTYGVGVYCYRNYDSPPAGIGF